MRLLLRGTALTALVVLAPAAAFAEVPAVVASVKPVHSLVSAVMGDLGTPELLLPATVSPHVYTMRPSDARRISGADLLFWIGPGIESFLGGAIETLGSEADVVRLADAPGLILLPYREGGFFEPHSHGDDDHDHGHDHDHEEVTGDHAGHHHHGHEGIDAHIWLDPANAAAMTRQIAQSLASLDPENGETYRRNADREIERLEALGAEIRALSSPVAGAHFIVFHDSFQYFENAFGVEAVASVTISPEVTPGARRISELQEVIRTTGAVCLAAEPQFPSEMVELLATDQTRSAVLDPYGVDIAEGPELYGALLRQNAEALADCLADRD